MLPPTLVTDKSGGRVVAITNEGRMLVFPVSELPELSRGKGNKIIAIPTKQAAAHEDYITALTVVNEGQKLVAHSGKRFIALKRADLDAYQGERGRRGNKLPRGFQRVERVDVE
jgi:topoisomerase-4 subunit A